MYSVWFSSLNIGFLFFSLFVPLIIVSAICRQLCPTLLYLSRSNLLLTYVDTDQTHSNMMLVKIICILRSLWGKLRHILKFVSKVWINEMINFPSCYRNAMICVRNLPECRVLNELCLFIYVLPCIFAACPQCPLGSPNPRNLDLTFFNPNWVDNEASGGETEMGEERGNGREL